MDISSYIKVWSEYYDIGVRDAVKKVPCATNFSKEPDGAMCGYLNGYMTILEKNTNRRNAVAFMEQHLRTMKGLHGVPTV